MWLSDFDGIFRDIHVVSATFDDWHVVYPFLRTLSGAEYFVDNTPQSLPESVEDVFAVLSDACADLYFKAGDVTIRCFFYEEMEFDIHREDVTCQAELDDVLRFVRQLGDLVGKRIIITPEFYRERPFITYDPERQVLLFHQFDKEC